MNAVIYEPLSEFKEKLQSAHAEKTQTFFRGLVEQSGVDIDKNRETVQMYNEYKENLIKLKKKLNWWRFLRVLMCISIVLIPLVVLKTTPINQKKHPTPHSLWEVKIAKTSSPHHNQ